MGSNGSYIRHFASKSDAARRGPVSYVSLGLTMATGAGLVYWYENEKQKKLSSISGTDTAVVGKATIGGPFKLVDSNKKPFTEQNLLGKFTALYFGFTHCPDICPEELEKVASAIKLATKQTGIEDGIVPVFITVDPERDGPVLVGQYVKEFHPKMIGLTGSVEAVKDAAKQYRVYYTKASLGEITGAEGKEPGPEDDYLIDHSIITYLLDPEGSFVTFYGKNYTDKEMADSLVKQVNAWKKGHPDWLK
jgi:protein SCO1/2